MMTVQQRLIELAHSRGEGLSPTQERALARFQSLGLPAYRSENYQRTDLSAMLGGAWMLTETSYACEPGEAAPFFGLLDEQRAPQLDSVDSDPLAQLSRMLTPAAGCLRVPKGTKISHPVEIVERLSTDQRGLSANRLVIILEEDAEVELTMRDCNESTAESLSLQCIEIYLGRGAKLHYTDIEESGELARRISTLHLYQEADSEANINFFSLGGGKTRNNFHCDLRGEAAHLSLGGLVVAAGHRHVDNHSFIAHSVPHCTSSELFKYVLEDESYGVFTGRILVATDAQKTQAYQNNRNLLLSPQARMQAKPQLEIYADDVKCSHGMTTGQLSEEALFYMRQRGIGQEEAKRMLSIAFTEDVLRLIDREALRDTLRQAISERFTPGAHAL